MSNMAGALLIPGIPRPRLTEAAAQHTLPIAVPVKGCGPSHTGFQSFQKKMVRAMSAYISFSKASHVLTSNFKGAERYNFSVSLKVTSTGDN